MSDDDVDEYLDPEFDRGVARSTGDGELLPGPLSLPQLVVGLHLLTAGAVLPFIWLAYQAGNVPQMASLGLLLVLILAAMVPAARIAQRRAL
jgi:hypothetical protein